MDPNEYKLLLVDLDGTLIGRGGKISPRVSEAIGKVSDRLSVSIATGREQADVLRFASQLGLTAPQVSDGGAMILDPSNGRCMMSWPLPARYVEGVIDQLDHLQAQIIATHSGGTVTSLAEAIERDVNRISALDLEESLADRMVAQYELAEGLDAVKVFLPYSGLWAVDFTRAGVNKATAALKVAELIGVEPDQMIAVGDSYNDVPLLQAAELRIAMEDAPEELKAIADYIAPTVEEDGLAMALEEFVMPLLMEG